MDRSREEFERWFCERWKLTQMPKPEHRKKGFEKIPSNMEGVAEDWWGIWKSGWDARR